MQFLITLEQWGLANYSQNFINEGITDESFCLLDDSTIHLLIDKAGPRLIFQRNAFRNLNWVENLKWINFEFQFLMLMK
ncbi:hypothetical protein JTB14_033003 [Gonioctena quinquepunctata]|nr:hypothetical protein JTB14_033003 [Gonioctena quinquepunctata]